MYKLPLNFELQLNLTQMSKIPLSNSLLDTADVVFLAVRPPVPHPLDLNLSLFSMAARVLACEG
jgi:hypothetical protein